MPISPELLAKLRALKERTAERGFTEAEALASAQMLRQLLDRYGLSLADLERAERTGVRPDTAFAGVPGNGLDYAFGAEVAVALFFDVIYVSAESKNYASVRTLGDPIYFGLAADVAAAAALAEIIHSAMSTSWFAYAQDHPAANYAEGEVMRRSFQVYMSARIARRLRQMRRGYIASSNALVVLKGALVARAAGESGVLAVEGGAWPPGTVWNMGAMAAGELAGQLLPLGAAGRLGGYSTRLGSPAEAQRPRAQERPASYQQDLAKQREEMEAEIRSGQSRALRLAAGVGLAALLLLALAALGASVLERL